MEEPHGARCCQQRVKLENLIPGGPSCGSPRTQFCNFFSQDSLMLGAREECELRGTARWWHVSILSLRPTRVQISNPSCAPTPATSRTHLKSDSFRSSTAIPAGDIAQREACALNPGRGCSSTASAPVGRESLGSRQKQFTRCCLGVGRAKSYAAGMQPLACGQRCHDLGV